MGRIIRMNAGGFSPLSIPSLALWLDASDYSTLTFNSTRISQWRDKSGKGNHVANATGGEQPLYVASAINGKSALRFYDDGTAKMLSCADNSTLSHNNSYDCLCVFVRLQDLGATETICGIYSQTSPANQREWRLAINGTNERFFAPTSSNGSTDVAFGGIDSVSLNTPYLGQTWYDGVNMCTALSNGLSTSSALASVFTSTSPFFIGSRDGLAEPYAGHIGEIRYFTSALSALQRWQNVQDMAKRWNITLP